MKTIAVSLNGNSLNRAIRQLERYKEELEDKAMEVCERLASRGAVSASLGFARAIYTGLNDASLTVEETENGYRVLASGETVLFLEFGAGVTYGYGHPLAGEFGYGPGTWPGKGHWDDPNGWYLPDGSEHTFGNPPNMPMYNAAKEIESEIIQVVKEVFSS